MIEPPKLEESVLEENSKLLPKQGRKQSRQESIPKELIPALSFLQSTTMFSLLNSGLSSKPYPGIAASIC